MANILGISGLNTSAGTNKLLAAYGNDIVDVDTGTGYGLNISSTNNCEFESFLDSLFWQNFNHTPLTFSGSAWTNLHVKHTPKAKFIKQFGTRMYLGYVKINATSYPSRIWFSDLPTIDGAGKQTIQWGFMSGSNGVIVANSNRFKAANAGFKTYGIKVGDTLVIESGANAGNHTVSRISDDQMIEVTEDFTAAQAAITYWVGSNWFDVRTDNSDVLMWLSENSDRLLVYKTDSLHRYDPNSKNLQVIRGPGTSSGRSVIYFPNRDVNIYFHGSNKEKTGFYMCDGRESIRISNAAQPFVDGIAASFYDDIVAWREGDVYRAYAGDLSNANSNNESYNITRTKAVFSYNLADNKWSVDPIADVIVCAGKFRETGKEKYFLGNDSGEVFESPSGYNFNANPIAFFYETKPVYPRSSEIINIFTRLQVVSRDAGRVSVSYKLWDKPYDVDQTWNGLGDLEKDITEFIIPSKHNQAAAIQLRFAEFGTKEPVPVIEKISVYSYALRSRNPEIRSLA